MNSSNQKSAENSNSKSLLARNNHPVSFISFKRAIVANTELRKQIKDIVDLGLFEYAYRRNVSYIESVRRKAEAETMELMMQFVNGADNYQKLQKIIQRNRIIKTLANKDMNDHEKLINRVTGHIAN